VIRSVLRVVTLLACALVVALGLAACGDGNDSPGAKGLLEQTFRTTATEVKSGRLTVDAKLDPEGLLALAGPITLKVNGPFAVSPGSGLPTFDLDAGALIAGRRLPVGVLSDGKQVYLELDGDHYVVDDEDVPILDELRSGKDVVALAALGIDPRRWITDAEEKGSEQIGGVETTRIEGGIDAGRLLSDVGKVLGSQSSAGGSAEQRERLAEAVKKASVEVWSGQEDKILRQVLVRVTFDFPPGVDSPIPGLDKGTAEVRARLDDINGDPPTISAPARSKPFSELPDSGVAGLVKCVSEALKQGTSIARCAANILG